MKIRNGRWAARHDGEFVVFLLGAAGDVEPVGSTATATAATRIGARDVDKAPVDPY